MFYKISTVFFKCFPQDTTVQYHNIYRSFIKCIKQQDLSYHLRPPHPKEHVRILALVIGASNVDKPGIEWKHILLPQL